MDLATSAALIGLYFDGIRNDKNGMINWAIFSPYRFSFLLPNNRDGRKTDVEDKFKFNMEFSISPFNFR